MGESASRARISADRIDIRHADGTRETIKDGVYRLKEKRGVTGSTTARATTGSRAARTTTC